MQNKGYRRRQNQKSRRKGLRVEGAYIRGQTERYCVLHPTKGFRDRNIISLMAEHQAGYKGEQIRGLNRALMQVQSGQQPAMAESNKPTTLHRRSGG